MSEISVIVPVYRAEKTISRCIDSILVQDFTDFELILVNDCSPDKSGLICDQYAEADRRIRVAHKSENQGVAAARNTGLELASGRFIAFCDSDDCVAKDWLSKMYTALVREEADLAVCGFGTIVWERPNSLQPFRYEASEYSLICDEKIEQFWRRFLKNRNHLVLSCCNKLFRMEIIKGENLRFDESLAHSEDALFVFEYVCAGGMRAVVCNDCLYYYSKDIQGSLTTRYKADYWDTKKRAIAKLRELFCICGTPLPENDPDLATYTITLIDAAVHNIATASSALHFSDKIALLRNILRSDECAAAFANGQFVDILPKYCRILQTRSAVAVFVFLRLAHWKNTRKCFKT